MEYILYNADTLNRYAKDCHQRAVAKGFWDEPHSVGHYLMLVVSELSEAVEADRLGKVVKLTPEQVEELNRLDGAEFVQEFLRVVKDTVWDEIADAVIRLLDLLGWILGDMTLEGFQVNVGRGAYEKEEPPVMLTDAFFPIIANASDNLIFSNTTAGILNSIKTLEQLCDHLGIDLMAHIELKLKYNATRPALHGKKY